MTKTARVLGVKTLPSSVSLHSSSPSSTHPLITLSSPSTSTSNESKVSLYRTTGQSDLVWEWNNVGEPVKPTGLGLKGKSKAAPVGKVQHLAWSPTGNFLAVAIGPSTSTNPSTLVILSLHSGKPLDSPPIPLPTSSSITHLSWQTLDYSINPSLSSWSIELVRKFPGLPKIVKASSGGTGAGPGGNGTGTGPALGNFAANPGAGGGGGGGGGGVFGAKQAMLERERAKEAQRALNLRESSGTNGFPTVLSDVRPEEVGGSGDERVRSMLRERGDEGQGERQETDKTILCVGDEGGMVHLYLGGNVFLGTVKAGEEGMGIVGVRVLPPLPRDGSSSTTARFAVYLASDTTLSTRRLSLPIPPSLQLVVRQASAVRATVQHAFEALQEVRNLWDEARRIGKGWLQRVADVSRPQGVVIPPATQLHLLLVTGQPTRSLHDFLASKMNERGLVKWEQEMGLSLDKMKRVGWMSVVPALERTVILLLEVDAWARWPDKFGTYGFDRKKVLKAIEVIKEAIKLTVRLQAVVEEEGRCFKAFSVWLHYELDKLAQQEGAEVRPNAAFHPVPVSHYIEHSLSPQTSPINPYLSMGLASISLSQNAAITSAEKWVEQLELGSARNHAKETLDSMLKRLGEELSGQKEKEQVARHAKSSGEEMIDDEDEKFAIEPPFAQASTGNDDVRPITTNQQGKSEHPTPTSIPILLHLVGQLVGDVMSRAMKRVGDKASLGDRVERGPIEEDEPEQGRKPRRVRSVVTSENRLYEAWTTKSSIHIARQQVDEPDQVEFAAYKLATQDGSPLKVFDVDFVSGEELAIAIESQGPKGTKQSITVVDLRSATFSRKSPPDDPPLLPLDAAVSLDSHFPPSHVSMSVLNGQRIACTLAGEGRRIEFHDFDAPTTNDEMDEL
ncbi:hypothetical protein JCM16303_006141 [Sporobolomyces ruberrimus]